MDPSSTANASGDAQSDDGYDLLNSETFGDVLEDFDWDAATEEPAEADNAEADNDVTSTNSKLDLNVAELLSDDEPDDPAIITVHARNIPTVSKEDNLKLIYGPQSPPAYASTLDSLLDPAHDIWGSPQPTGNFKNIPSISRSADKPDIVRDAYLSKSFDDDSFSSAAAKSNQTLQEDTEPCVAMPSNAMTVEELERQFSSEPKPVPTQPSLQTDKPVLPAAARQSSPSYIQSTQTTTPPHMYSPINHQGPPHINGGHNVPPSHPLTHMVQRNMPHSDPMGNRTPRPVTILHRHPHQRGLSDPNMYRMMTGRGQPPHNPIYNNMTGYSPRPQQMHRRPAPIMRFPGNVHPHRAAMLMQNRMSLRNQPRHPMQLQQQLEYMHLQQQQHQHMYGGPPRDEYAGLLTRQEKDWLIKIQMIQLHTDDPYVDDYYYTIYNIEKNEEVEDDDDSQGRRGSTGELILPALAKLETRTYTPMQFEGSLGRLTSSSVHKPRQVLDVGDKSEQVPAAAVDTKRYRQALIRIEKAYQLILEIDELKKKLPSVPEEKRSELDIDCQSKIDQLYQLVEENWSSLLTIRKGRSLILRTLPIVNKDSSKSLLEKLLHSLGLFVKKELSDPVDAKSMKGLDSILAHCDISSLLVLADLILPAIKPTVKTSFGCYLILTMIKQAEKIYSAFVEVSAECTQSWEKFVDEFLTNLRTLKSPPSLKVVSMLVYDHLSKRPDSESALSKVELWFKRTAPQ